MFKKIVVLLFFLSLLILTSKEKTELVYKEIDYENGYEQIYLLFEDNSLNTNNFDIYFKDLEVIKVYPYINPIYAGRLKSNYNYTFTKQNHRYDLERFKTSYIEKLRSIGLNEEANQYQVKGVIINKVLVYSNLKSVSNVLKNYNNIKYSSNLNGIYRKLIT